MDYVDRIKYAMQTPIKKLMLLENGAACIRLCLCPKKEGADSTTRTHARCHASLHTSSCTYGSAACSTVHALDLSLITHAHNLTSLQSIMHTHTRTHTHTCTRAHTHTQTHTHTCTHARSRTGTEELRLHDETRKQNEMLEQIHDGLGTLMQGARVRMCMILSCCVPSIKHAFA